MNELQEAISGAAEQGVCVAEHGRTLFRISGADGLDLLHRIATNDLLKGPAGRATFTSFCNEKGRVIDAAEVLVGDAGIHLICSEAGAQTLTAWIEKFTITEDIQLTNVSADFSITLLLGPHAATIAEAACFLTSGGDSFEASVTSAGRVHAWEASFGTVACVRVLTAKSHSDQVVELLKQQGISYVASRTTFEFLRMLHCVPAFGHEINGSFTPYEIGLTGTISFTKGCYIGQEVIARIDTYKKARRELRMLWSESGSIPQAGTPVVAVGENVGVVTSGGGGLGRAIALAVIQRDAANLHKVFEIGACNYRLSSRSSPPYSLFPSASRK